MILDDESNRVEYDFILKITMTRMSHLNVNIDITHF